MSFGETVRESTLETKGRWFWIPAILGIVIDQVTKFWIYTQVDFGSETITVIPGFFDIVHAQNSGAAMGLLSNFAYRQWVFFGFTVLAIGVILNMLRQLALKDRFLPLVLGLIFSGAIGNLIDRIHKGTVTDFLRVHADGWPAARDWLIGQFGTAEWPSFNVADSALVVGVALFVIHYLFLEGRESDEHVSASPRNEATVE